MSVFGRNKKTINTFHLKIFILAAIKIVMYCIVMFL